LKKDKPSFPVRKMFKMESLRIVARLMVTVNVPGYKSTEKEIAKKVFFYNRFDAGELEGEVNEWAGEFYSANPQLANLLYIKVDANLNW